MTVLSARVADLSGFDLLLAVARSGSIGRAAVEHGISQPTASARLAHLESRVGVALLARTPRGTTLTSDGALVADWARDAIAAAHALDVGIGALRGERRGRLAVYASMTVAEYALPMWLVAFGAAVPDTAVSLRAGNSSEVTDAVLAGEADLGFVESPTVSARLTSRVVGRDELRLVVAPSHPWARRRAGIGAAELAATPLISREEGSGTRAALLAALPAARAVPPLVVLASTTAIKAAVTAGLGPAVLSSLAVASDLAAGTLVAVPTPTLKLSRRLRAVWPAGRTPVSPAADLLALAARRPVQ
jgi:DNA-binding transcriptional LysR family regulator